MSEIEQFEERILTALNQVSRQLDKAEVLGGADTSKLAAIEDQLVAERANTAQLTERLDTMRDRYETLSARQDKRIERLTERIGGLDLQVEKLRTVNAQLRELGDELRAKNEKNLGDGGLINRALEAEIAALRVEREAEVAEMGAIIDELKPLMNGAEADDA